MKENPPSATQNRVPLVSVAITAYNHEKYLQRAIESALEQLTPFPIEIVIGDDCSQDGTTAIAESYQERFPEIVRVLRRSQNLGMQRNYYETFAQCRGKFIAWLDADDYWTAPDKLTVQVQALEDDPSIMLCGHVVRWVTPEGVVKRENYPSMPSGRYGLKDILRRDFLMTPSVMFRNGLQKDLPAWYFEAAPLTDWPLWIVACLCGDILLLDRTMADYTLTPGSAVMSKGAVYWYKTDIAFYGYIESMLPTDLRRIAREEKGKRYEALAYSLRQLGDLPGSRKSAIQAWRSPLFRDNFASKTKSLASALFREAISVITRRTAE